MKEITFPQFTVQAPDNWYDVTAELEGESPPLTVAPEMGLGALQFSIAALPSERPQATVDELRKLLKEFAKGHDLGSPLNIAAIDSPRPQLAANFTWNDDFLRVWYISDNGQLAFLTYTCEKNAAFAQELDEAEQIIRSLRFASGTDQSN